MGATTRKPSLREVSDAAPIIATGCTARLDSQGDFALEGCREMPAGVQITNSEGLQIRVARGIHCTLPVRGLYKLKPSAKIWSFTTVIHLEEGSSLEYVDEYFGTGSTACTVQAATRITLEAGAKLKYQAILQWPEGVQSKHTQVFNVGRDATLEVTPILLGGLQTHLTTESHCLGKGSSIQISGAAKGKNKQTFEFDIITEHSVTDTKSTFDYLTVMGDQSKAVFNGLIRILQSGARTDAYQKSKNLLLSPQATIEAFPKLEIATDDVKVAHGASISPVNPDQIYYLQSRGISALEAETMIIDGFTEPVLTRLTEVFDLKSRVSTALVGAPIGSPREFAT